MTTGKALDSLNNLKRSQYLLENGYKKQKCKFCKGTGTIFNTIQAVYNLNPSAGNRECRNCHGEGIVWIAPITK